MKRRPRGISSWPLDRRFWRSVDTSGECWTWTASKWPNGYGRINVAGRTVGTHRVAYELEYGPIPEGMFVCHTCDRRDCVRPTHLFLGSVGDNNRDMWSKGRGRGLDPHNGKLTDAQRREAVARVGAGETKTAVAADYGVTRQAITHLVKAGIYA